MSNEFNGIFLIIFISSICFLLISNLLAEIYTTIIFNKQNKIAKSKISLTLLFFTKNNENIIEEFLQSLNKLSYQKLDVVIIDNVSSDNTVENIEKFINRYKRPKIKLITRKKPIENYQLAKTVKQKYLKGDIVFVAKQPIVIDKINVSKIIKTYQNPKINYLTLNITKVSKLSIVKNSKLVIDTVLSFYRRLTAILSSQNTIQENLVYIYRNKLKSDARLINLYSQNIEVNKMNTRKIKLIKPEFGNLKVSAVVGSILRKIYFTLTAFQLGFLASIALVALLNRDAGLFVVGWTMFILLYLISIIFSSEQNIITKLKNLKHLIISYILFLMYIPYSIFELMRLNITGYIKKKSIY